MKSGTTSLYHYLKQHPQIYMSPVKEPKFFALEGEPFYSDSRGSGGLARIKGIRDIKSYQEQFEEVSHEIAIGEASPLYIYVPKAVERIKYYIPEAKLIAILRHPVDRAYSHFLHWVQRGLEPLDSSFESVIREEEIRISQDWSPNWHYKQRGFYYQQLKRYYENFNREQIKVYLYEDLRKNSIDMTQDICRFLGVDDNFVPDTSSQFNVSKVPRNKTIHVLLTKPNPMKNILKPFLPKKFAQQIKTKLRKQNMVKPELEQEIRMKLIKKYRDDILKLQDLIEKDLSKWLNC